MHISALWKSDCIDDASLQPVTLPSALHTRKNVFKCQCEYENKFSKVKGKQTACN